MKEKMPYFDKQFVGEKNNGFAVLYHNMKHGQISTKELAEFVRERAAVEEAYSKAMCKLSKVACNSSQIGTFAPMWDLFRISSDKLALCHLELTKKLNDLIKEINRYGEEQVRMHRKQLSPVSQLLPQTSENTLNRAMARLLSRVKREPEHQMYSEMDQAEIKLKKAAESFKSCVEKYNFVRVEFEQKMMEASGHEITEQAKDWNHPTGFSDTTSLRSEVAVLPSDPKFSSGLKGTIGFEECNISVSVEAVKKSKIKPFRLPGLGKKEKDSSSVESPDVDSAYCPEVDEEGFRVRPDVNQNSEKENHFYSSSDSDFDDDEPKKFHIHIKPAQPQEECRNPTAYAEELKATVGNLILPPNPVCTVKRQLSTNKPAKLQLSVSCPASNGTANELSTDLQPLEPLFGPPLESAFEQDFSVTHRTVLHSSPSPFSSSPENVEDSGLDSPCHAIIGPFTDARPWSPGPNTPQSPVIKNSINVLAHSKEDPFLASMYSHSSTAKPTEDLKPWTFRPSTPPKSNSSNATLPFQQSQGEYFLAAFSKPEEISLEHSEPWVSKVSGNSACNNTSKRCRSSHQTDPILKTFSDNSVPSVPPKESLRTLSSRCESPITNSTLSFLGNYGKETLPVSVLDSKNVESFKEDTTSDTEHSCSSVARAPVTHAECSSDPSGKVCHSSSTPLDNASNSEPSNQSDVDINDRQSPVAVPPRRFKSKRLSTGQLNGCADQSRSLSPSPGSSPLPSEWGSSISPQQGTTPVTGLSRGPSPVVLGSQDALPVATAFTEYIHAYFKGGSFTNYAMKITGELTMSFPAGIIRILNGCPSPPVLSFRLLKTSRIDQFLPNPDLLFSDPSQSDPNTQDFWLNMQSLTSQLQKQAELTPAASYYNVGLLKYQVSKADQSFLPLKLVVQWKCSACAVQISVSYKYNSDCTAAPTALSNAHVVIPVEGSISNVQLQPPGIWNAESKRVLWKLTDICDSSDSKGSGMLLATWQSAGAPTAPSVVAAQFTSEGNTLSGVDIELASSSYRMSLVKKRFAAGKYIAGC
ncbi:F-BAR domain only protein 1-like [Protopterus annectens]|uniref:F-BAR domain only protein 1-like n=1 Tax=Protopterus annectens TaxID=7888 RepID=UPI001CFAE539|nr:F-BAR domain only protein 1-like [Protopterus annectens]